LYNVTEPALSFLRRRVPVVFGGLDLSPLIIIAAIMFLRIFLVQTLQDWAQLIH
jgi:YggT family protein